MLFPIFHPMTEEFIGYEERDLVHTKGSWHKGVQANIIRPNEKGSFDILLQLRSEVVDIGKNKYDQSLATQMIKEDNLSEEAALKRGLEQELGILKYRSISMPAKIRIIKQYKEQPEVDNREFVSLYIVVASQKPQKRTKKIKELFWIEWQQFKTFFNQNCNNFTKTGQLYFSTPTIIEEMEKMSYAIINRYRYSSRRYEIFHISDKQDFEFTQII